MMKDITRIHIAKVPYNIELPAKKELEKYIDALELYTGDHDVMEDVEIRITELLLERKVKQDDVITIDDVKAIRTQLGEPKDFLSDDEAPSEIVESFENEHSRRLYRNLDTALLGGVLSGVASYFKINPMWIRLIFIILSFASFGLFVLLYIVLWLTIPPARTAAEKLQLSGQPVTLLSIRALNELGTGVDVARRAAVQKRIATILLGVVSSIGAVGTVVALAATFGSRAPRFGDPAFNLPDIYKIPFLLAAAAGVLLVVLFLLVAFASFAQKFNKRIWISGIIIIVLGLGSFGSALFIGSYAQQQAFAQLQRDTVDTSIKTPEGYTNITSLSVDVSNNAYVVYIVDNSATSITQRTLKTAPKVAATVENGVLKLKLADSNGITRAAEDTITLYGPSLKNIVVTNGYVSYNGAVQSSLNAEVYNAGSLRLIGSRIDTLTVKTDGVAQFSGDEAAIAAVQATLGSQSSIDLGNIKALDVTTPDVCATDQVTRLSVESLLSTSFTHNGTNIAAKSLHGPCIAIHFSNDQTDDEYTD